jgi:thiol-disulfide isomerase/thioredoxin
LLAHLLSKFCGTNQAKYYWEQAITSLQAQPEVSWGSNLSRSPSKVDLQKTIGGDLIDAGGHAVSFETLKGKKYYLMYFSAAWCSHCRQFMPQFLDFYRTSKYHDKFEVIFVSSDRDESQMLSYLREMPWKAVRFNSPAESFLKTTYSRGPGVPTLALIDSDGRLLCFRKGFARNYDSGVDKMLDILSQKLSADD